MTPAHTIAVVRAAMLLNKHLAHALADLYELPAPSYTPASTYARVRLVHASLCPCQGDEDEIDDVHLRTCPWADPFYEPAGGFW